MNETQRGITHVWFLLLISALCGVGAASAQEAGELSERFARFDANGDGKLSTDEVPEGIRERIFSRLDKDGDGLLDARELAAFRQGRRRSAGGSQTSAQVRIIENIEYATGPDYGDDRGKLDLYLPKDRKDFPVILFFHGGALANGDKSSLAKMSPRFVNQGYAVAAANYRLSPLYPFPAYMEDAAVAFKWVCDHIGDYDGDREQIIVSGGSAGGHIAALLSLDDRYLARHDLSTNNIRVSIPITGLMDVQTVGDPRISVTWSGDPTKVKLGSPITHVRKDAPPMLLMVADGDTDVRREQNKRMFDAMRSIGNTEIEFEVLHDRLHSTILPNMAKDGDPTVARMLDFLRTH